MGQDAPPSMTDGSALGVSRISALGVIGRSGETRSSAS